MHKTTKSNSSLIENFFIILLLLIFMSSCKEDPVTPPPPDPEPVKKDTLNLILLASSSSSITLNITITQNNPGSLIQLFRVDESNEIQAAVFPLEVRDTTITDSGLERNAYYSFYAVRIDTAGERKDSSNIVTAGTFDTTSHGSYTWQEFTFGDAPSNEIRDIWGTDENNVWAAGIVSINDKFYGGFHWNGSSWTLDSTAGGKAIYGFSTDDIWMVGGNVYHYNGSFWEPKSERLQGGQLIILDSVLFFNSPYFSVWGTSSSNLYLGSTKGKIIHWNGTKASIAFNVGKHISDIYGTGADDIWALGYEGFQATEHIIAHFNGISWTKESIPMIYGPWGIYYPNKDSLFLCGNGLYFKENTGWVKMNLNDPVYCIRGTSSKNIFAGGWGKVYHYNGYDWHSYSNAPISPSYYGVYSSGSKVFLTGLSADQKGKIVIGTKIEN